MCRLMVTGGGTGGHIYPALTLAEAFRSRHPGAHILYVGTSRGLEATLVPKAGFDFETIEVRGLVGKSPAQLMRGLVSLWRGMGQAGRLVGEFGPQLVVGTGGYVSGPVVWAAARAGVPTLIQEQNVNPGVTNRILSRVATRVALPHDAARSRFPRRARTVTTGNPVRAEITVARRDDSRRALGYPPDGGLALIMGGSQGAARLNAAAMDMLSGRGAPCHIIWVTGHLHHATIGREMGVRGIDLSSFRFTVRALPYLERLPQGLAAADVVVGRAGAMTLAEITARGLPSILIPFPHARSREQELNARQLEEAGAAMVIPDHEVDGDRLWHALDSIVSGGDLWTAMAAASAAHGRPGATDAIVREMEALIGGRR